MTAPAGDGTEYLLWRHALADGEVTTLYAVRYPRRSTRARVVHFPRPERLDVWCRGKGVEEAIVGGFFLRDPYRPLGELWIDGRPAPHEPVAPPYGARRGSVVIDDGRLRLVPRAAASARPRGDLVQAGPMLVADSGLSMVELAEVMVELGAESAINLDGGGSTTLVHRGHLLNRPYSSQDQPAPASREIVTALTFAALAQR